MEEKKRVYIVNKSTHNFEAAKEYGEITYLSEGPMNRYECNNISRQFIHMMRDSTAEDYLVPCSLSIMNMIAAAILTQKHKRLNLLLFKDGRYIERNLVFD